MGYRGNFQKTGVSGGAGDIGIGSGMIYDSGKAHHIAIPYIDENGIPQAYTRTTPIDTKDKAKVRGRRLQKQVMH
jgi:hypothetical protein